jgi:hypothetical protein
VSRRHAKSAPEPLRQELEAIVLRYRHVSNEHVRAARGTSARRHHAARAGELRERFERRVREWFPDPELRLAWRRYLEGAGPEPETPNAARPLVFRGRSEIAGSIVEIRGDPDDYTVEVDGALVERITAKDFPPTLPPLRFRVVDVDFVEIFAASAPALDALRAFREHPDTPPWEYAPELFEDGLIGVRFDLTPRGDRALVGRDDEEL